MRVPRKLIAEKTRILLAEDDENLSLVLQDYLAMLDFEITACSNGKDAIKVFRTKKFDLCLLDVMMPLKDGFTLAEEIRALSKDIPIIFLTAKTMPEDRIRGFRLGCDDYITKPFNTEELSLRISAVLKRTHNALQYEETVAEEFYHIGGYIFDYPNMTLSLNSVNTNVTRKEADLLRLLCKHKNHLVKRETALRTVWGEEDYFIGRSMDVFITKLRKLLKDDPSIHITNVHATGFKLEVWDNPSKT